MYRTKIAMKKIVSVTLALLLTVGLCACSADYAADAESADNMALGGNYYASADMDAPAEAEDAMLGTEGESYTEIVENAFVSTAQNATSYFSIDANTVSYPNLRSLIQNGYSVPADAVRVEEMLNYFDYDYETPTDGALFTLNASVFDTPYNSETKLMTIGLAAQRVEFSETKNNLVFLIDTSGSMFSADKLALVQNAFMMLTENLNPEDRVSIVTYAGSQRVALEGAYGHEKLKIAAVIEDLAAGGSTAGSAGITTAYQLAEKYFIKGGNNRVILATDGDFNVGVTDTDELEQLISEKRQSGVYFSVFGVGRGNLQAEKMETLALNGNGTYSYIDSVNEAKRALVEQIGGSMITVAKDVKAGVIFNPDYVESYRLIGYENKLLTQEQFEDDTTDAGELGSGHTVTVAYEIKLTDKALAAGENLAQVTVKYKPTENVGGDAAEKALLLDITTDTYHTEMTETDTFVASVIEFALLLRDSVYKQNADFHALITRMDELDLSADAFKQEFRDLVNTYMEKVE
ncbi:MAG: von Willebrand factor type A domain-containing protein [Clostridia bacterium]|nr:von Willebrand factor type A domain-containing protein [Clostridia bacterium]